MEKELAHQLKVKRVWERVSAKDLAERLGLHPTALSNFEHGRRPLPKRLTTLDYVTAVLELAKERDAGGVTTSASR